MYHNFNKDKLPSVKYNFTIASSWYALWYTEYKKPSILPRRYLFLKLFNHAWRWIK